METAHIINGITSRNPVYRKRTLEYLYKQFYGKVEHYVLSNSGEKSDAKDVFQEGVIIVYQNVKNGKFNGSSSIGTYLYAVCKNIWLMSLRKNKIITTLLVEDHDLSLEETEELAINNRAVQKLMEQLKEGCQKILLGFYFHKKTMVELSKEFQLGSSQAAKNKKFRCLKKLSEIVSKQGLERESFLI